MNKDLLWEPDVKDWDIVTVESYQFIIEQAKERLEEVSSESNIISSRSITLLLSYFAIFSTIVGFIFSDSNKESFDKITITGVCLLAIFSIYIFTLLFALIAAKLHHYKGSPPKEIFKQEYFENYDPQDWFKMLLYIEVVRIQIRIERIQVFNNKRMGQYRAVLRMSLLFVALLVFALVRRIFSAS